jgi:hypothetical protein
MLDIKLIRCEGMTSKVQVYFGYTGGELIKSNGGVARAATDGT